jgi:oxalate decarboxylase/phosphoglucose isomerase-like protein (cupin superfamily)
LSDLAGSLGVATCRLLELPLARDPRGRLTYVEEQRDVPIPIMRVYFIAEVPAGEQRAGHAHRRIEEIIVCAAGSVRITVDDGHGRAEVTLDRPDRGLYIPTRVWHEVAGFSAGAVVLGLASLPYDDADHVRDYDEFLRAVRA